MLMLLSARELFRSPENQRVIRQISHAVAVSTREIDIFGWYEHGSVLAVLFTEIGPPESNVGLVIEKVSTALQACLKTKEFDTLELTFHVFPDTPDTRVDGDNEGSVFYREATKKRNSRKGARLLKRSLDIIGSIALLVILSPLLLAIAIVVRLTSEGPVLFRQFRIGQFGAPFTFYKFRSMYTNNDSRIHQEYVARLIDGEAGSKKPGTSQESIFKLTNDPRVTPAGKFLRRTSLDELPQLFNVLFGDMSLVGPRPPLPYEYERYQMWHRRRVFDVKPGITGLWQVTGRSKTTFDEMVRLDLNYAKKWSLWLDLKILLKTPSAVLSGDGAY